MNTDAALYPVFTSILAKQEIVDSIEKIDIRGIEDDPGLHWSNPGLKKVLLSVRDRSFSYIVKTLGEHSKREILVYRFLSNPNGFPMPEIYYDVLEDNDKEYWMVLEECFPLEFSTPEALWGQVGLLLGRIHTRYWNKIDKLPEFFNIKRAADSIGQAFRISIDFLASLTPGEKQILENDLAFSPDDMASILANVDPDRIFEWKDTVKCLIHGAFHRAEIMWVKRKDRYEPVGVDWERSRIGTPGEDLKIVADFLAVGDIKSFDALFDAYFETINTKGITTSKNELAISARRQNLIHSLGNKMPWILRQYLTVHQDDKFESWCQFVREHIPPQMSLVKNDLEGDLLYQKA